MTFATLQLIKDFPSRLGFLRQLSVYQIRTGNRTQRLHISIYTFGHFFFGFIELDIAETCPHSNFGFGTNTRNHIGWCHMTIKHALTILGITYPVIHQVPVHTVRTTISGVTSVTALPSLIAMSGIIKVFLPFLLFCLGTSHIHVNGSYRQRIHIYYIQYIGKVGGNNQFIT